jgi:hypothetical protein
MNIILFYALAGIVLSIGIRGIVKEWNDPHNNSYCKKVRDSITHKKQQP